MRLLPSLLVALTIAPLAACSGSSSEGQTAEDDSEAITARDAGPDGKAAQPSANGNAQPADAASIGRNAVVYLQRIVTGDDGLPHLATCTGALVAPNLVVTAHHCVATVSSEATTCTLPNSDVVSTIDTLTGNVEPTGILVSHSADRLDADEGSRILRCSAVDAIATRLLDDGTMTMCDSHDVAWLVLDRPIALPAYPPIREDVPAVGEPMQGYGWGRVSKDGPLTRTMKSMSGHVVAPESSSYPEGGCIDGDGDPEGAVGFGELVDDSVTFKGDSGGPVYDQQGRLVAVHSRNSDGSGNCLAFTKSTRLSAEPESMRAAFAAASAAAASKVTRLEPGEGCR